MPDSVANNGWNIFAFAEMVQHIAERVEPTPDEGETYVGLEHLDSGSLTVDRWGTDVPLIGTKLRMRKGDILFARRNAYLRRVALAPHDGLFSAHGMVLRARPHVVLPEFLPFFMQSDLFMDRAERISVGSLSPTINWGTLKEQQFALPPLEEQRRIATMLRASESHGEALRRLVTSHDAMRRSSIDGLTDDQRWPETTIGDHCGMQNGRPFPGTAYVEGGVRLLRPGNLDPSGYLTWEQAKTVCLSERWERDASDFLISPGDVLMNLTAQSLEDGFMGRVCLARTGDKSLLNQRIGRFCNWSSDALPEYVFRVFQGSRFQAHAVEMCEGSKVKHIFWPYIARFVLRLPPLAEQMTVVTTLREVDSSLAELIERARSHSVLRRRLIALTMGGDRALASTSATHQ